MYCISHFSYKKIPTVEVTIGALKMGGDNPIRIQSMTTTDTMDTEKTVQQTLKMVEAGCELVRITAPSMKEAENLRNIQQALHVLGCKVPLVADIHFTPNAAEVAAKIIEKVRVNPGNYADKKKFENIDYTDASYQAELKRIDAKFSPLVKICKERGTAMRIGTNHGSLSDRIMSRYGDSPLGMVESAWEFIQICEAHEYYNLVVSMKASNPQVMVQAYRLLMDRMLKHGRVYPLHLGVTEAGEGEDGRIKSALGISTLLLDGIGDTVRVSLTEDPEFESPVAKFLIDYHTKQVGGLNEETNKTISVPIDPFSFTRRSSHTIENIGHNEVPRVVGDISGNCQKPSDLAAMGYTYVEALDKYNFADIAADFIYTGKEIPAFELPGALKVIVDAEVWKMLKTNTKHYPYFYDLEGFLNAKEMHNDLNFVRITTADIDSIKENKHKLANCVLIADSDDALPAYAYRAMVYALMNEGMTNPVLAAVAQKSNYDFYDDTHFPDYVQLTEDAKIQLSISSDVSTLLVDGLLDGVWIKKATNLTLRTVFGCLQMSRLRITKTEYISCPSCGRTLFDLMETTAKIRVRTEHLKGVKIGIMGCIVNGPGEMADADYGYVGVGPDKISLYRGKEVVLKAVKAEDAVDKLIDLIREDGKWIEPIMQ